MSLYSCSICKISSKTKGTIQTHINNEVCKDAEMVKNIVFINCEVCGKKCETEKLMESHKKNCIKKRVQLINNDVNGELKKHNEQTLNIILLLKKKIDKFQDENEELKNQVTNLIQRITKLEKTNKDVFEELNHEDSMCEYNINDGPFITSHKQVCEYFKWKKDDIKCYMKFYIILGGCVIGCEMSETFINVNGKIYVFDKKNKKQGNGLVGELQISDINECKNIAKFINEKTQKLCCEEHKEYFR